MSDPESLGESASVDLPPGTVQIARSALLETTPASTIGPEWTAVVAADSAVSVLFPCTMSGYPGWNWTVTLSLLGDERPSVLEVELLPGEGALLAPEWVPWSDRLAEYNTAQELAEEEAARALEAEEDDSEDEDDEESDETLEETDLTDDLDDVLDGVEFEETDDDDEDDEDSEDDDEDEDSDEDYDAPRTDEDDEGNVY